jgi:hypothetical protein
MHFIHSLWVLAEDESLLVCFVTDADCRNVTIISAPAIPEAERPPLPGVIPCCWGQLSDNDCPNVPYHYGRSIVTSL